MLRAAVRFLGIAVALPALLATSLHAQFQGWLIPDGGRDEQSPLTTTPAVLAQGRGLFQTHCAHCHRPDGTGAGPGSDHAADLTDPFRAELNTDGVLFYKVWNGHAIQLRTQVDDMPAFSGRLTKTEVWALVAHLKELRAPAR